MKTILMKFSGPLQAWGVDSHFESRRTDKYPSKSAVIGLIAASFGFRKDADEKIQSLNDIDFAIRIDQPGNLLRDYHTAQQYEPDGVYKRTYVTNRYFLEDAVFVVAIGHKDDQLMNEIEEALKNPYFQPFMGRRSLPLPADFILEITEDSVIESIKNIPWQASSWYQKNNQPFLSIYCDSNLVSAASGGFRKDKVFSFSQNERKYGYRRESKIKILLPDAEINNDHDAFSAIGE